MNKKGQLFYLVQSMSPSEKRYFKLYTGSAQANYQRLFNFIEKQHEPDDAAIRKHFKNEPFTRQLHVAKIYLSDLILEALRNYHNDTTVYSSILNLLRDTELLFTKELYDLCRQKLDKAGQLALAYEKDTLLLEVQAWRRKLMLAASPGNAQELQRIDAQEKTSLANLGDLNYLWEQTHAVFRRYQDKNFMQELELKNPATLQSKTLLQHVKYLSYFMTGQPALAEKAVARLVDTIEQMPARITDDPSPYITAISNLISILIGQQRWHEIDGLLAKMRKAPALYRLNHSSRFTQRLWLRIFNLELEVYRDTGQMTKALPLIKEIERFLQARRTEEIPDNYRIMLYYQIAAIYFSKGSFSPALKWINHLLNHNFGDTRTELQCYARLVNLLIHFELNNIIVLRYSIDSARRFFKKKKFNTPFAQEVLRLATQLSHAPAGKYPIIFEQAHARLFKKNSVNHLKDLDYIDLKTWFKSKGLPAA